MKKALKIIGIVLGSIVLLAILLAVFVIIKGNNSFKNLQRVDSIGSLYYIDYVGNYESPVVTKFLDLAAAGCSAFITENENGEVITCRNFDYPHHDDEGNPFGLNVIVKCTPEGKYASIGIADIGLFSIIGLPYYSGSLDSGNLPTLPLMWAPYLCLDGLNEMGLSVTILALDLKEGETATKQTEAGKPSLMVTEMLRQILDNCASLEEAIEFAEGINAICTFGEDYHLFVTDATGASAVFEWRYNDFTVTYTDAVTNFYVGYDDGCDSYNNGVLKDAFVTAGDTLRDYHYGYGHGYGRFATIASTLDSCIVDEESLKTSMTDDEAMALLSQASQDYDPDSPTSFTQYSVIYNNTNLSVTICPMRNYDEKYVFSAK